MKNNKHFHWKHQSIIGVFFMLFFSFIANAQKEKIRSTSAIWLTLETKIALDSTQKHHLTFTHQQRYGHQISNFSNAALFQFIYRMDNGFLYEYTPSLKWKTGIQERFVLRNNKQEELFSRFFLAHISKFKTISFEKRLAIDWFHPLNDSENPNIIKYDLARFMYQFVLTKDISLKNVKISPYVSMDLFQIMQLQEPDFSPYQYSFFDMTRYTVGLTAKIYKIELNTFIMNENRYFGRSDGSSSLQIVRPNYGLGIKYFW